jgi:diguanylate cyclase (GGDEF)-like protein/PAS domain S-box-containing protein
MAIADTKSARDLVDATPQSGRVISAAFWRMIGGALPDALIVFDDAGLILAVNAAATATFQFTEAELTGRPITLILPVGTGVERLISDGSIDRPAPFEIQCSDKAGLPVIAEVAVAAADAGLGDGRVWIAAFRVLSSRKAADALLIEVEERLASITANLPGVVFQRVMHRDGSISYPFFTAGVKRVLGFAPENMRVTADGCLDVIHWADRADHLAAIRESGRSLAACVEEFRAISKDGDVRWLRGTSRPQALANGDLLWDGVLIDVTDRKRAEQTLQMIMDHAADSIITIDVDGRIESVNAAVETLFDYAATELVGQSVSVLMPEPYRSQHDNYVARYLETGEGKIIGQGPRELVGRRRDGSVFAMELATSEVRLEGRRIFIGIGRDITKRKETEAALRETEQRLRNIASNLPGIVFQRVLRPDGLLEYPYVSDGSRDVLGIEPAAIEADGSLFLGALAPEIRDSFLSTLRRSARTLEPIEEDLRVITRSGQTRWLRGRSRPRLLPNGSVAWEGVMLDVSDRRAAEEQLTFLAYYDPLTRVGNRALFLERFAAARDRMTPGSPPLAVLSLGIDRFSIINTTMGHDIGDKVLTAVADRLKSCLGEGDTIARAGGDRFLMLLTGLTDEHEIMITVEQILVRIQDPMPIQGEDFEVAASIGISVLPGDGKDGETLVKNADAALLRAKNSGPGTFQRFTQEMNEGAVKTLSLQHRLRRALDQEEFVPFFQPQVDLIDGRIVGMEALVRWMSPEGMVSPAEFIPIAEEYGLIDGICEQMLRSSCQLVRAWQVEGLPVVPVAVNISGRQFHQPRRLVQTLETVLSESGLAPQLLELELTESSAMRDPDTAISVVRMLTGMGLGCSIDDFGTGYSSLSVLKRFPIQKLKIDRSFVMDITNDPNDAAIVTAIVAMAHALRLKVVAEGVEEISHLEFLRGLGCDTMQGYLFSRPVPAADMRAMLAEGRKLKIPS